MPLQRQDIDIPFAGGMDQGVSERLIQPGKFKRLENCFQDKLGELRKRRGFDAIANTVIDGTKIPEVRDVFTFKDELVALDGDKGYSRTPGGGDAWDDKGRCCLARVKTAILDSGFTQGTIANSFGRCTVASANGFVVVTEGTNYSIWNEKTNTQVVGWTALTNASTAAGAPLRAFSVDQYCYVLAHQAATGNLLGWRWDMNNPTASPSTATLETNMHGTVKGFDAAPVATRHPTTVGYASVAFVVLYCTTVAGSTVTVHGYDISMAFVASAYQDLTTAVPRVGAYMSLTTVPKAPQKTIVEQPNYLFAFWEDNATNNLRAGYVEDQLASSAGPWTVAAAANPTGFITAVRSDTIPLSGSNNKARVFWSTIATPGDYKTMLISSAEIDSAGTVTSAAAVVFRSAQLIGKAWRIKNSLYFPMSYMSYNSDSVHQDTVFVGDSAGNIVSRVSVARGPVQLDATYGGSDLVQENNKVRFVFTGVFYEAISPLGATVRYPLTVVDVDFSKQGNVVELENSAFVSGGQLMEYDGIQFTESGFHVYPEAISLADAGFNAASGTDAGAHSVVCVYAWKGPDGRIHRSAPSAPQTITVAAQHDITITYPNLRLGTKKTDAFVEIYMTTVSGSVYYLFSSYSNAAGSDTSARTPLGVTDVILGSRPLLYTTGGYLDHIAPPEPFWLHTWNGRVFIVSSENIIYYSKIVTRDEAVAFCDALRVNVSKEGGDLTSLGSQDGQLLIGKENQIFRLYGDGPNNAGQGEFSGPYVISSDVGAEFASPMTTFAGGTIFSTKKGIYAINRSFQTEKLGDGVDSYSEFSVKRALVIPDEDQILFQLEGSNDILCFNSGNGSWSVFTGLKPTGIAYWDNEIVVSTKNGQVKLRHDGFHDDDNEVSMLLETGWMTFGALLGYFRLWELMLLGEFKSKHTLNMKLEYPDGQSETKSLEIKNGNLEYLYRLKPKFQKSRAVKLTIWDSDLGREGEGAVWTALRFGFGVKKKLPLNLGRRL